MNFKEWEDKIHDELVEVLTNLDEEISDEPEALIKDLVLIEGRYGRMGYILAQANSYLSQAEYEAIPKEEKLTETQRKALIKSKTALIHELRDKIESIYDAIKIRINLGQSILAFRRQSLENSKILKTQEKLY